MFALMGRYLLIIIGILFSTQILANDFFRKAQKHKQEYKALAEYIIREGYHRNFSSLHYYFRLDTINDRIISNFCKKFKISEILIQGTHVNKYDKVPSDSVIIFQRKHINVVGTRKEIIVDCSMEKKDYPDFKGYGQRLDRIDRGIYYYEH
ncbi:MAG: hypothetical protein KF775_13900 [Cyclobacteriaceae bacterium]|nr:hypothetical protein [Cyclobacteriaceae bacterium]